MIILIVAPPFSLKIAIFRIMIYEIKSSLYVDVYELIVAPCYLRFTCVLIVDITFIVPC